MKRAFPGGLMYGGGMDGGMAKMPRMDGGDGEWACPQCGNVNFAGRVTCNMRKCGAPKPGLGGYGAPFQGGGAPAGSWICTSCGNNNYEGKLFCNMRKCGVARPGLTAAQLAASASMQGTPPPMVGAGGPRGGMAGGRPAPDGSWVCISCKNVNFPSKTICNGKRGQCGMPREQADAGPPQAAHQAAPMLGRPGDPATALLQTIASAGVNPNALSALLGAVGVQTGAGLLPGGVLPAKQGGPPPEGSWQCLDCGNVNFPQRTTCNGKACGRAREEVDGGPPPPGTSAIQPKTKPIIPAGQNPEGSWVCPGCQNINWPTRTNCNKRGCGLPRPADA